MGWADLLEREEIPYASEDAWDLAREIASVYYTALDIASAELAKEYQPYKGGDRRNGTLMAIAPNGHIARLARCSPSIYPKFENYADVLKMTFEQHIQTVMAWQATVDGGVSYTVNLPSDVTSIGSLFDLAHASGVKAISVYRDGSILGQPVRCADGKCGI
jgi:ribonucleoside-diphosphate reductase alpha chain